MPPVVFRQQAQLQIAYDVSASILIVDDEPSVRLSMLRLLVAHGYTAIDAADADGALQKAQQLLPDVILMDLQMPGASGIDATRAIKAHPQLKHTPIIALSASIPEAHGTLGLFNKVLCKPCPCDQILEAIESVLRH